MGKVVHGIAVLPIVEALHPARTSTPTTTKATKRLQIQEVGMHFLNKCRSWRTTSRRVPESLKTIVPGKTAQGVRLCR